MQRCLRNEEQEHADIFSLTVFQPWHCSQMTPWPWSDVRTCAASWDVRRRPSKTTDVLSTFRPVRTSWGHIPHLTHPPSQPSHELWQSSHRTCPHSPLNTTTFSATSERKKHNHFQQHQKTPTFSTQTHTKKTRSSQQHQKKTPPSQQHQKWPHLLNIRKTHHLLKKNRKNTTFPATLEKPCVFNNTRKNTTFSTTQKPPTFSTTSEEKKKPPSEQHQPVGDTTLPLIPPSHSYWHHPLTDTPLHWHLFSPTDTTCPL